MNSQTIPCSGYSCPKSLPPSPPPEEEGRRGGARGERKLQVNPLPQSRAAAEPCPPPVVSPSPQHREPGAAGPQGRSPPPPAPGPAEAGKLGRKVFVMGGEAAPPARGAGRGVRGPGHGAPGPAPRFGAAPAPHGAPRGPLLGGHPGPCSVVIGCGKCQKDEKVFSSNHPFLAGACSQGRCLGHKFSGEAVTPLPEMKPHHFVSLQQRVNSCPKT